VDEPQQSAGAAVEPGENALSAPAEIVASLPQEDQPGGPSVDGWLALTAVPADKTPEALSVAPAVPGSAEVPSELGGALLPVDASASSPNGGSDQAPQGAAFAPEIAATAEVAAAPATEVLLASGAGAMSRTVQVEAPEAVAVAPQIGMPAAVVAGSNETPPAAASEFALLPSGREESPLPRTAVASVPADVSREASEADTGLAADTTVGHWSLPPAAPTPRVLSMAPSSAPSAAVVRVALTEERPANAAPERAPAPGTVTVDFVDTPLTDVFKSLAFQTGKGILVHENVKGRVTLKLEEVPLDTAVDLICSMYNLSARRVANVYLITPKEAGGGPTEAAARESRMYYLKALSPQSALSILQQMVPEVKVVAVPEQRGLILLGTQADLAMAAGLLDQVDRVGPAPPEVQTGGQAAPAGIPAAIRVQHVPVASLAAKMQDLLPAAKITYDESLSAIFISGTQEDIQSAKEIMQAIDVAPTEVGVPGEAGTDIMIKDLEYASPDDAKAFLEGASKSIQVTVSPAGGNNRIVITAPKGMYSTVKQLVDTFDVAPREVVVEALITDMSQSLSKQLGFAWDFGGTAGFSFIAPATTTGVGFPNVQRGTYNVTTVLSAIQGDSQSKILARPRIRTVDAKEAKILIGERLLFQVASVVGGTVVYTIKEERVGVNLTLTPRITKDGHVLVTIHPEVSTLTGFNPQGYPNISTRETDSTVLLKDGETLVIGGLIQEQEIKSMSKVPILSEVPLLGELFKRHTRMSSPSEVMIFVTPHIVNRGEEL
jgi:type II secretory pathway component GspD/PulD (secretin)